MTKNVCKKEYLAKMKILFFKIRERKRERRGEREKERESNLVIVCHYLICDKYYKYYTLYTDFLVKLRV